MALAIVQQGITVDDTLPLTQTATLGAPFTAGNMALVFVAPVTSGDVLTVTDTDGNTYTEVETDDSGGTGCRTFLAYNLITLGGNATVTALDTGTGYGSIFVVELSGVHLTAAFDTSGVFIGTSDGATGTTATATPSASGEGLVLVYACIDGGGNTFVASGASFAAGGQELESYGGNSLVAQIFTAAAPTSGTPANCTLVDQLDFGTVGTIYQVALTVKLAGGGGGITLTVNAPIGFDGTPYNGDSTATGGTSPYVFSVQSGVVPPGLTYNANGTITGTPTTPGVFTFVALVTDAAAGTATNSVGITIYPTANVSPQSNQVVSVAESCLPENRRLYTATIDWSVTAVQPFPTTAPYINLPELTINDNSADGPGHDNSIGCFQIVYLTPGNNNQPTGRSQAIGLSCIKAMMFYYRQTFGFDGTNIVEGGGDFAVTADELGLCLVTNMTTNQTVALPAPPYTANVNGNPVANGCFPFFAGPTDTIRVLKLNEGSQVGYGKLTLQFANFDIAPYVSAVIGTLDNNT
jgi:hypothetical protein